MDDREREVITLSTRPGDPGSFSTLACVLSNLSARSPVAPHHSALTTIAAGVARIRAAEQALAGQHTLDDAALASRGALAALRRVTQESAQIAIVTDRAARSLNQLFVRPGVQRVIVPCADGIDRPSLKVLARACLIAKADEAPVWEWQLSALPDVPRDSCETAPPTELGDEVRGDMLRTVLTALRLGDRDRRSNSSTPRQMQRRSRTAMRDGPDVGVGIACGWLTTQNFDAAIRWAVASLAERRDVDALRVLAMAATNTGRHDLAVQAFNEAYGLTKKPTLRAHLCSMQALIIAKRRFDLSESRQWYAQGLAELAQRARDDDGDPAIEEAWIYNGLALNALLEARFSRRAIGTAFEATFDLLQRAFKLVQQGWSSDRVYLRYNLLGNMSTFMQVQGNHRIALDLFERSFDESLTEGLADAGEWQAILLARRAGLYASAGETDTAVGFLREAVEKLVDADRPICAETLRRSVGILSLRRGRVGEALATFREGLTEALEARSRVGATVHGAGLIYTLVRQGRPSDAAEVLQGLAETEDLWFSDNRVDPKQAVHDVTVPGRLYGLSTSIPEVDLENLERVSISDVLHGSGPIPHVAA